MESGELKSTLVEPAMLMPWVRLADQLGMSRSLGQLYGLLFLANKPLSAQDCVDALGISRSSAGQGLKALKELGAIQSEFAFGDRCERFSIEPDLGVVLSKVIEGRLVPAFARFFTEMQAVSSKSPNIQTDRFLKLERWKSKLAEAVATMNKELM